VLINDFVENIRNNNNNNDVHSNNGVDGIDDTKTKKLLDLNKKLDEECKQLKVQNEKLSRDLFAMNGDTNNVNNNNNNNRNVDNTKEPTSTTTIDVHSNEDMKKLLQDNTEMHKKLVAAQSELLKLISVQNKTLLDENNTSGGGQPFVDSQAPAAALQALLAQYSDRMLLELQDLRRSQHQYTNNNNNNNDRYGHLNANLNDGVASNENYIQQQQLQQSSSALPPTGRRNVVQVNNNMAATPLTKLNQANRFGDFTPLNNNNNENRQHISFTPMMMQQQQQTMNFNNTFTSFNTALNGGPTTPHGKALLHSTTQQLNLPPEEWALDVRDLNSQLIECLEQLYEREGELDEQKNIVDGLEANLLEIRQQLASVYHDYTKKSDSWELKEKNYTQEITSLNNQRDDLKLKLKKTQDLMDAFQREDKDALEAKLIELTRKTSIYEVNEAILRRKFKSQDEQLKHEQESFETLQVEFVEMESSLKKRILYLEQFKTFAISQLNNLNEKLDKSVSQEDFVAMQWEMDVLREDHLATLHREVEARLTALQSLDHAKDLRSSKIINLHLQVELEKSRASMQSLRGELEHQKEATVRALQASKSSTEVSNIVSEMARFRGETSRLEVELLASNRKADLLASRMQEMIECKK
jgi:hypothetical protein